LSTHGKYRDERRGDPWEAGSGELSDDQLGNFDGSQPRRQSAFPTPPEYLQSGEQHSSPGRYNGFAPSAPAATTSEAWVPPANCSKNGSRLGVQALIWAIVGVVFPMLFVPSILAIILGEEGRHRSLSVTGRANKLATAGMVIGSVMTVLAAWAILVFFAVLHLTWR